MVLSEMWSRFPTSRFESPVNTNSMICLSRPVSAITSSSGLPHMRDLWALRTASGTSSCPDMTYHNHRTSDCGAPSLGRTPLALLENALPASVADAKTCRAAPSSGKERVWPRYIQLRHTLARPRRNIGLRSAMTTLFRRCVFFVSRGTREVDGTHGALRRSVTVSRPAWIVRGHQCSRGILKQTGSAEVEPCGHSTGDP